MKLKVNVSAIELLDNLKQEMQFYSRDFLEELHSNIAKELQKRTENDNHD